MSKADAFVTSIPRARATKQLKHSPLIRAVREKHAARYLAELEYRFNRRYDLGKTIPRLATVALSIAPVPYRLLKLADARS